jgi:hypothetical protein
MNRAVSCFLGKMIHRRLACRVSVFQHGCSHAHSFLSHGVGELWLAQEKYFQEMMPEIASDNALIL